MCNDYRNSKTSDSPWGPKDQMDTKICRNLRTQKCTTEY